MEELIFKNLEECLGFIYKQNNNMIESTEGIFSLFEDETFTENFEVIFKCKKCNSTKISLTGEDGIDYGEYTGYCSGSNVIKCENCGIAVTIWK